MSAWVTQLPVRPGPECGPPESQNHCSFSCMLLPPQVEVSFLYAEQRVFLFRLPPSLFFVITLNVKCCLLPLQIRQEINSRL